MHFFSFLHLRDVRRYRRPYSHATTLVTSRMVLCSRAAALTTVERKLGREAWVFPWAACLLLMMITSSSPGYPAPSPSLVGSQVAGVLAWWQQAQCRDDGTLEAFHDLGLYVSDNISQPSHES
jgi:hypothetical protein